MSSLAVKYTNEEDDDQWISGEELRTEESSDDDIFESSTVRKKHKTDMLLKRLLVSSLAFPPETKNASSPTTFLPSIGKSDKVVQFQMPEQKSKTKLDQLEQIKSSTSCDEQRLKCEVSKVSLPKVATNDELDRLSEMKRFGPSSNESAHRSETNMTDDSKMSDSSYKFKPKSLEESLRRSLELDYNKPYRYEKGEVKSTNHLILEMNEFYFEMVEQLKFLRYNLESENMAGDQYSLDSESFREGDDEKLLEIQRQMVEDEAKINENYRLLEIERKESDALLDQIKSIDNGTFSDDDDESSKEFLNDSCFQPQEDDAKKLENDISAENASKKSGQRKRKHVKENEKDFITKNRELAKQYGMPKYRLTDEESIKLESLLSDIDVQEDDKTNKCLLSLREQDGQPTQPLKLDTLEEKEENEAVPAIAPADTSNNNGFKFQTDEEKLLDELESKLMGVSDNTIEISSENDLESLRAAEEKGRLWKMQLMKNRLKTIDTDLVKIQEDKDKEKEDMLKRMEDMDEVCDRDNNEENYKKSIEEVGIILDLDEENGEGKGSEENKEKNDTEPEKELEEIESP